MIIRFEVNGSIMGSELNDADIRHLTGRFITDEPIVGLDIIRNGEVIKTIDGRCSTDIKLDWTDKENLAKLAIERELTKQLFVYYYTRVRTVNGQIGWASPIWINKTKSVKKGTRG